MHVEDIRRCIRYRLAFLDDRSITQICEKPSKDPKTAPLLETNHIKFFEKIACDENTVFGKRIYAAAFALMCHGSLRYDDTTTLESLERNETSILGKVSQPKVRSNDAKKFFCYGKVLRTTNGQIRFSNLGRCTRKGEVSVHHIYFRTSHRSLRSSSQKQKNI